MTDADKPIHNLTASSNVPLHPVLLQMLQAGREAGRPAIAACTPAEARAMLSSSCAALGPGPEVGSVRDVTVPTRAGSIAARLFRPDGKEQGLVVYVHGGGWVLGSLADFDALARNLASRSGCAVLLIDYRLAPEHLFPAGLQDVEDAIRWAAANCRQLVGAHVPLIVGGDSAGANLATVAVTALAADIRIALQLLFYPVTDCDTETPCYREHAEGLFVTRADMQWFYNQYAPGQQWSDPRISPLRATNLRGAPPAWIAVAGFDVLRDEAVAYAQRLAEAGVPVRLRRFEDLGHGFARMMNVVDAADRALDEAAAEIRKHCDSAGAGSGQGSGRAAAAASPVRPAMKP